MRDALEELDIDGMESVIHLMDNFQYEGEQAELFERLKCSVDEIDVDTCEEIIGVWENIL